MSALETSSTGSVNIGIVILYSIKKFDFLDLLLFLNVREFSGFGKM